MTRWAGLLAVIVASGAVAQWMPPPTPRPTATRPAPTATPRPTVAPTARPTVAPTRVPTVAPSPSCPAPTLREFVFIPGMPLNAPAPGEPLRFADGGEFVVLVRFQSAGEIPFRLVRIR